MGDNLSHWIFELLSAPFSFDLWGEALVWSYRRFFY